MIAQLHFLRPWWWLAMLSLPLILLALTRSGGGRAALARLADASLLPHLVRDTDARRHWALLLASAIWLLAVAALAGPAWQRAPTPLYANGAARVIALSLSDDMRAQDLKPDRMTRARYAVRDLLEAAGDARSALIGYAGDAFVVAPLTPDKQTVLNLLDALSPDVMPAPGNNAARAIEQSLALLQQAHVSGGEIVLVSDDADHAAVEAARNARAAGVRVDVLGVGSTQGAPVPLPDGGFQHDSGGVHIARRNDAALRDVASAGGGRYAPLQGDGSGVAALGAPPATQGSDAAHQQANVWRDGGAWLLIPLLPLVALAFRRGWLCVLALMSVTPLAHSAGWNDLWARPDQRALHALQQGDYGRADKLAHDPELRGAVAYRRGDYAAAADQFARSDSARSEYDLGNALAKNGKYNQAIAAYDRALRRDPRLADARANRQAVLDWLKRHPRQSQASGNQGTQGNPSGASRQGSSSSSSGNPQQASASNGKDGSADDARNQRAQAGANQGHSSDAQNADSAAGKAASGGEGAGDSGASVAEDAQQRTQVQRAQQALRQELAQRQRESAGADAAGKSAQNSHGAYALGAEQAHDDDKFDPQQRAMLNAVPDDPGALLRRKFMLEWQRRHGQPADDDGGER
ncbi:MAG TPA: VWA domain-containing protein [Rhodanobacteraceae bacterium]|nr:VWA domain-containing protein [Rhodanobacteraceae bacterium]